MDESRMTRRALYTNHVRLFLAKYALDQQVTGGWRHGHNSDDWRTGLAWLDANWAVPFNPP